MEKVKKVEEVETHICCVLFRKSQCEGAAIKSMRLNPKKNLSRKEESN